MLERLQTIFRDVLDTEDLRITPDTLPSDVPGWDSMAMLQIVVAVEAEFGVSLPTEEVAGIRSVGDLLRMLGGAGPVSI